MLMVNVLIAYGTRMGASSATGEEIAVILRGEGFNVKVANLKDEKMSDITSYDLVIVGSGIQMGKWHGETEDFLIKYRTELDNKKLAIYVSSMTQTGKMGEEEKPAVKDARQKYVDEKVAKYSLKPISTALFGGVLDFSKMNWLTRKIMEKAKPDLEKDGMKEIRPGFYDTRDLEMIRSWARELAAKTR